MSFGYISLQGGHSFFFAEDKNLKLMPHSLLLFLGRAEINSFVKEGRSHALWSAAILSAHNSAPGTCVSEPVYLTHRRISSAPAGVARPS